MNPLGTVVVGVDGSDAARRALSWAARRATSDSAIHAVHAFSPVLELALAALQQDCTPLRDRARADLEGPWTEPARAVGGTTAPHFVEDDPADAIMETAAAVHADTIVIGPHGGGASAHGLGRVTRKLLRDSSRPIVIVDDDTTSVNGTVLACVGYGRASDDAADWAARFAEHSGRPLVLLHVVSMRPISPRDAPSDMLAHYLGGDLPLEWARSELDQMRWRIQHDHPTLEVRTKVGRGSAAKGVVNAASDAEIVVIGRPAELGLASHLMSTRTRSIITGVSKPVAVIPWNRETR